MAIELITGHAGTAHVSSSDAGWFNAGALGSGKYVLETGTQLAATVQSANLVTIGIGDALFEGRHVHVSSAENVSIDNGAQGVNRNDIICIKYEYNSGTGVESASIAVVKGTATSGTPTDPTIPSGSILAGASTAYMPLWRIPISGINAGTPVQLFTALPSLAGAVGETVQINRGGTGATNAAAALQNIMGGKAVLYSNTNGTTGTVTLSQSAANFNHMRVYATSPYGNVSCDVYDPDGKSFSLNAMSTDNSGITTMYVVAQKREISGTSVTVSDNGYAWLQSDLGTNQISGVNASAYIKIIRVEAWNE